MSKAEFFHQLRERLRGLPFEEQMNIISVYEDLFRKAEEGGKSEREIVESLGYRSLGQEPGLPAVPSLSDKVKRSAEIGVRAVVATIALGLFNLIVVLAPFVAITLLLFALGLTAVLLAFSSIWIAVGTGVPDSLETLLMMIFTALATTGLGVLMSIGLFYVGRGYWKLVKGYARLNLRLIKGE